MPTPLARLFTCICMAAWPLVAAADDPLAEAERLLAAGQAEAAYTLLAPLELTRAGDTRFDFALGVAAIGSGRAIEATIALERVLDQQPTNAEARAWLGRAHFELGEDDTAREQFEGLREAPLPPVVAASIDQFLTAIEQRIDATRTRWDSFFETGAGFDTNVSNATDVDRVAVPAVGGVLILADASREQASALWTFAGGTGFATPLDNRNVLFANASLAHRAAVEAGDFNQFTAAAQLGLAHRLGANDLIRLAAMAQRFDVGGDRNRDLGGATIEWQHRLSQRTELLSYFQYALLNFPLQPIRDAHRYIGGLGIGHAPGGRGSPMLFASVYGGVETAQTAGADFVGRQQVGVRLGGEYTFDTRTVAFLAFDYAHSRYHGVEPLFLRTREEDFFSVVFGARQPLAQGISLRPQIGWAANRANLPLFDFKRWEATLNLRSDF